MNFNCGPMNGGIYGLGPNEEAGYGWCYYAELGKKEIFFSGNAKTKVEAKEKTELLVKEIIRDMVRDFNLLDPKDQSDDTRMMSPYENQMVLINVRSKVDPFIDIIV